MFAEGELELHRITGMRMRYPIGRPADAPPEALLPCPGGCGRDVDAIAPHNCQPETGESD